MRLSVRDRAQRGSTPRTPTHASSAGRAVELPKLDRLVRLQVGAPRRRSPWGRTPPWYGGGPGSTPGFGSHVLAGGHRPAGFLTRMALVRLGPGTLLDGIRMVRKPVANRSVPVACGFDPRPIRSRKCQPTADAGRRLENGWGSRPCEFDPRHFRHLSKKIVSCAGPQGALAEARFDSGSPHHAAVAGATPSLVATSDSGRHRAAAPRFRSSDSGAAG